MMKLRQGVVLQDSMLRQVPVSVQEGSLHGDHISSVHMLRRLSDSKLSARIDVMEEWQGRQHPMLEDGNFSCPFEKLGSRRPECRERHALLRGEPIPSSTMRQLTFEAGKLKVGRRGVQSRLQVGPALLCRLLWPLKHLRKKPEICDVKALALGSCQGRGDST